MFAKKTQETNETRNTGPLLTILRESARIEGKLIIGDSIQIECEVADEINVEGKLVIGERGVGASRCPDRRRPYHGAL